MNIGENQLAELNKLFSEGIACKSSALEGKKDYVKKVQEWVRDLYQKNDEEVPFWLYKITIPKVIVANENRTQDENIFYDDSLGMCLQQLEQIRSEFFLRKHLKESIEQTKTAQKNLEITQKSLRMSICALIASISVPILISIVTVNFCTSTVKLEEQQYKTIKAGVQQDSTTFKSTIKQ